MMIPRVFRTQECAPISELGKCALNARSRRLPSAPITYLAWIISVSSCFLSRRCRITTCACVSQNYEDERAHTKGVKEARTRTEPSSESCKETGTAGLLTPRPNLFIESKNIASIAPWCSVTYSFIFIWVLCPRHSKTEMIYLKRVPGRGCCNIWYSIC